MALRVVGQLGGHPHAVALGGDRPYLGVGPRVLVFEMAPTLRQVATSPLLPGIVQGLAVRRGLLAAALGGSGPKEPNLFAGGNCDELEGMCSRIFLQATDNVVLGGDAAHLWVPGQSSD